MDFFFLIKIAPLSFPVAVVSWTEESKLFPEADKPGGLKRAEILIIHLFSAENFSHTIYAQWPPDP